MDGRCSARSASISDTRYPSGWPDPGVPGTRHTVTVTIALDVEGAWARLTLERPRVRNAQTPQMWQEWLQALAGLPAQVRIISVHGAGESFSSGLDRSVLAEAAGLRGRPPAEQVAQIERFQHAFRIWHERAGTLTIAIVQGAALGAGCQLASACDLMWVCPDAQLGLPEVGLGLVPDLTGTARLLRRCGPTRALEVVAAGRTLTGTEACDWGIATRLLPTDPAARENAVAAAVTAILSQPAAALASAVDLMRAADQAEGRAQQERERTTQVHLLAAFTAPTWPGSAGEAPTSAPAGVSA